MNDLKLSDALWGLTDESQFVLLKKTVVDHELVEQNIVAARFQGNLQPDREREVVPLREGERTWKFWRLKTQQDLPPDSVVADFQGKQYRVMGSLDWARTGGFNTYRLEEQPPQSAPAAPYASGTREPIKVVADIVQHILGLSDDAVVLAYEKNVIPAVNGLYASLDYLGPAKCIANISEVDPVTHVETLSASYSQLVQLDLLSYDASARRRKEEAAMAFTSVYAVQLMEKYTMSISRNPSPWVDSSSLEPTKRLNRFTTTVQLFSVHRKVLAPPDLFEHFPGQITEGGPLVPFSPQPLLEI